MPATLGDTSKWSLFYTNTYSRNFTREQSDPDYGYIGEVLLPVLFDTPYLAVICTTATGKTNWRQAGNMRFKVAVGITTGGNVDAYTNQRSLISLTDPTLLSFDLSIASTYALAFRPFAWFNDITINVYDYTGTT